MRIIFARLLVVVTGLLIVLLAILFAAIRNPSDGAWVAAPDQVTVTTPEADVVAPTTNDAVGRPQATIIPRGRAVYVEQRCSICHSLEGDGNTRLPLDGVSGRLTEREIRLWIIAPQEMNPAVAKRGYKLSEEDLNALVAFLMAGNHH